jgi:hypothetical protein
MDKTIQKCPVLYQNTVLVYPEREFTEHKQMIRKRLPFFFVPDSHIYKQSCNNTAAVLLACKT